MYFKPITERYKFDSEELIRHYPEYLRTPIATWIKTVLFNAQIWDRTAEIYVHESISSKFLNDLNLKFREHFPRESEQFLPFVLEDSDRTTNILAICLQNFATLEEANELESILETGGSAYAVLLTKKNPQFYDKGISDLVERVPSIVVGQSQEALENEPLLFEAWHVCYSRNPDYAKTVSKCVDVLEGLLRDKYFPKDNKPVLSRFVNDLVTNPIKLSYKGDSLIDPKNLITDLSKKFIEIRGQHTKGTGREPTKEEAEFVLQYTIFIWNLHR